MAVRRQKGTGGVSQRGDGRWQATWPYRDAKDIKRVHTEYGRTKKEALDKIRDWKAGGGEAKQRGGKTVRDLVEHVLAKVLPPTGLEVETLAGYRGFLVNYIDHRIGSVRLDRLTVAHLDSVALEMMGDGLSAKTAKNVHIFLKRCMKEGKRLGWVNKDFAADMTDIRTKKYTAEIYSLPQVLHLIQAMKGDRAQPGVVLASLLGLREAESVGVMWADFDFKKGTLKIQRQNKGSRIKDSTKSESGMRTIAVPKFALDYFQSITRHSPFLMTSADGKKPMHPSVLYHRTLDAMEAAGLPKIRFHDLRHSANNVLKQLGVPSETRRDILGHSDTSVTENTYTQTVDWEMVEAMDKLETALRAAL